MAKPILVIAALAGMVGQGRAAAPEGELRATAAGVAARARPLVVLDPGHGGSNSGATGSVAGVHEKAVTLAISELVAARLAARDIDVVLTREADRTMTLRQRMVAANVRAADIFVSVHANASPTRTQRGFETFVLSGAGVDVDARALRAESGTPRDGIAAATALILDDVERGASEWEAAELAVAIQRDLAAVRPDSPDRGVRQDAHHVLLGATMPAVLVEVGFIDHPIEGRELADAAVQARIATAIAEAIAAQLAIE